MMGNVQMTKNESSDSQGDESSQSVAQSGDLVQHAVPQIGELQKPSEKEFILQIDTQEYYE